MYVRKKNLYMKFFLFIALGLLVSGCNSNSVVERKINFVTTEGKVVRTENKYYFHDNNPFFGTKITEYTTLDQAKEAAQKYNSRYMLLSETKTNQIPNEHIQYTGQQPQLTSIQQDILSTGNSPTQVSVPMAACSFLVNNQNVCTETNVTTATAIVSVAVLGGIIAGVVTAVNNQANSNEQRQKDNNLLLTLLALQNKSTGARVCYDSATPPNVIPCP